ncbi:BREX-1 system adenine-specific DNA-methyltransferase PglX [Parageobacillus thermoglucosidasius]|uniref:BREX-1 system adenine-specific DNA-methyltransferase PglX n=1 Tax=Parageobacillus thermoglucosidasius TaxID=1426 RepID=UPI0024322494|nr:BREX-1 system adenine-specific DNA-methyltransferase PglX [Parageobacillus thermoglucosidasius]MBY6269205.1 SAM-dependent methyltransferase [Parageobacillus thermoglucosidasius]
MRYKQIYILQYSALFSCKKQPDFLLDSESVIKKLVNNEALTESFQEVEVIGWLYQFYNTEPKDQVFANLKKNKKIEKYDIPAATQLFTPKWIVQYMVENSLGQLWLEANPDSPLKQSMRYYIEPAEQDEEVKQKLEEIRYKNVNLEEIKIIDPCVGSGHILVYAFDLLYQMYEEVGYPSSDIPQLILEKNLFGLDIDDRAVQLASFALMMKAREKSRRIFRKKVRLNIYAIQESNHLDKEGIAHLLGKNEEEKEEIRSVIETFIDAKNFGSILQPPKIDYKKYIMRIEELGEEQLTVETYQSFEQMPHVLYLFKQAAILASQYDVAVTNPPYMGFKGMNTSLTNFLKKYYPNTKNDLFAVMMERSRKLVIPNGFLALITMESWMFLSSYEEFRKEFLNNTTIESLIHMPYEGRGRTSLGINFGTTSIVIKNTFVKAYKSIFQCIRYNEIDNNGVPFTFPDKNERYSITQQNRFDIIPGSPIAYWVNENIRATFNSETRLSDIALPRAGMITGNNEKFLRLWHEVETTKLGLGFKSRQEAQASNKKWFPYNKGGEFQKWFGNNYTVVNWFNDGYELRTTTDSKGKVPAHAFNLEYIFKPCVTWSAVSSKKFSVRICDKGFLFDASGSSAFPETDYLLFIAGFLNSKVVDVLLGAMNPTINYQAWNIGNLPIILPDDNNKNIINEIVSILKNITKENWDSFETSWDFKRHPLLTYREDSALLSDAFNNWTNHTEKQFAQVKTNEEELNRIFIELYSLQNELTPEVPDEEITIRKADRVRDAKSFLSYFIGCVMGRYSLDVDGLAYAGGDWDESKYKTFKPNKYGLMLLTDEYYFEDDVIARLREFLSVTFGAETVEENLQWLAESLELKRNETAEERLRRYFL